MHGGHGDIQVLPQKMHFILQAFFSPLPAVSSSSVMALEHYEKRGFL